MNSDHTRTGAELSKKQRAVRIPMSIEKKFHQPYVVLIRRMLWQQINIAFGSLVAAIGFSLFQVPFKLAAGGISGLGIILYHFTAFPIGMSILLMNIPLMLIGFYKLGRWRFVVSTVTGVLVFSFGIDLFNLYLPDITKEWPITDDLLLASIYAGVLCGFGMGVVQRSGGTIGGTSIPARIFYEYFGFPMSQVYLFTDGLIVIFAGFVFHWEVALLASLTLVLSGIFSDVVLEGISKHRTAIIVTDKPEDVRWAIIYKLRRGVSLWPVEGGYSKSNRTMTFCTVMRSRVSELKSTIATVDPDAFVVIGAAQQVVGGYGQKRSR